jgi:hypothetical protein
VLDMAMTNAAFILMCSVAVGAAVGIMLAVLRSARKFQPPVYRRVLNETDQSVALECGHAYALVRHRRATFPCECCTQERNAKAE